MVVSSFLFSPRSLGKVSKLTCACFSDGLVSHSQRKFGENNISKQQTFAENVPHLFFAKVVVPSFKWGATRRKKPLLRNITAIFRFVKYGYVARCLPSPHFNAGAGNLLRNSHMFQQFFLGAKESPWSLQNVVEIIEY